MEKKIVLAGVLAAGLWLGAGECMATEVAAVQATSVAATQDELTATYARERAAVDARVKAITANPAVAPERTELGYDDMSLAHAMYAQAYQALNAKYGMPLIGDIAEGMSGWIYGDRDIRLELIPRDKKVLVTVKSRLESVAPQLKDSGLASVTSFLKAHSGLWYDADGRQVLDLRADRLNGCPLITGYNFDEQTGGFIRVVEDGGERVVELRTYGTARKYLRYNGDLALRPTVEPQYTREVMGVYLGMSPAAVKRVLGNPTTIYALDEGSGWHYDKQGLVLHIAAGMVTEIKVEMGPTWSLTSIFATDEQARTL